MVVYADRSNMALMNSMKVKWYREWEAGAENDAGDVDAGDVDDADYVDDNADEENDYWNHEKLVDTLNIVQEKKLEEQD